MYFKRVLFLILKYRLSQFSYISKLIIWDKCKISLFVDRDMFQSYRPKKAPFSPLLILHKEFHQEFFTRCKINKKWFKKGTWNELFLIQTHQSLFQCLSCCYKHLRIRNSDRWLTQSSSLVIPRYVFSFCNTLNDRSAEQGVVGMMLWIMSTFPQFCKKLSHRTIVIAHAIYNITW